MPSKEKYFDLTGKAMEAAKKAEAEARAKAAAGTPEPPKLDKLIELALQALGHARGKKGEAIFGVRHAANLMFERAMSSNARERFQSRFQLHELRYQRITPEAAKGTLDVLWKHTSDRNIAPVEIVRDPMTELNHSPVAIELVSRLTVLKLEKNLAKDPKMWWQELARAYKSIDFRNLQPQEEAELRKVFEASFDHMRILAKKHKGIVTEFPKNNKDLWRGLGDYYFSMSVPDTAIPPESVDQSAWNTQRTELNNYLKYVQERLQGPHTEKEEKDYLYSVNTALGRGLWQVKDGGKRAADLDSTKWGLLKNEVQDVQYRIVTEIEEFSIGRERRFGERELGTAEERAKFAETYELWQPVAERAERAPAAGIIYDIETALRAFGGEGLEGVRRQLIELDNLFIIRDPFEKYAWDAQGKLRTAQGILDNIERGFNPKTTPEQRQLVENYQARVRAEIESLQRSEQPPNRLYLGEDERLGLEIDSIGAAERTFHEAMEAFAKDPDGPLARFLLDRMELMQYYLFSRQHSKYRLENFDVVIVESKEKLLEAVKQAGAIRGKRLSPEQVEQAQKAYDDIYAQRARAIGVDKASFERSFIMRTHEVLYIQQWKHAAEYNDEHFQRVVNSRILEDDFWGMDGLYGGLLKRFRMVLHTKYEQRLFDVNGDMNPHIDRLWQLAMDDTENELSDEKKYPDFVKIWDDYLDGEYFKETPGVGPESALKARRTDPRAKGIAPKLEYREAVKMLTQFASYRMIMSDEKYLMDARFLPTRWGVDMGELPMEALTDLYSTQFYEKQKVVKLFKTFEGWQITWGGVTQGMTGEERLMMRERSEILRRAIPEINDWAAGWANDWWEKVETFGTLSAPEQRRFYGQLRSLFSFSVNDLDVPPGWKSPEEAHEWMKNFLSRKKLLEEVRFYTGMKISDMYGLFPYLGVSESRARRNAQFGTLQTVLGDSDLAKENFLTYTEIHSAHEYHLKKSKEDTRKAKETFLSEQAFLARYAPHGRLLVLREGESSSARDWIDHNVEGGRKAFGTWYGELKLIHEDIFAELALQKQVDYSQGRLTDDQTVVVDRVFMNRYKGDRVRAEAAKRAYLEKMKQISDYLLQPISDKSKFGYGALEELTNVRYGPLLIRMRRDDYPYEYMQYPERMLPILTQRPGHIIEGKTIEEIRGNPELKAIFLTRVSDKYEPEKAQDEQSGLWRRNKRDLAAMSGLWQITGDAWSLDTQTSVKARKQRYRTIVGVVGNVPAKINDLLDDGQRLAIQLVYKKFGPLLEGLPHSSPIKKVYPHWKSKSPDELSSEFESGQEASAGAARYGAKDAMGIEAAVKEKLRITYWNKWLGGMTGRAEFLETLHGLANPEATGWKKLLQPLGRWSKRHIGEKQMEDLIENLDQHAPIGVWVTKLAIAGAAGLLLYAIYSFQQAKLEGKGEREHS